MAKAKNTAAVQEVIDLGEGIGTAAPNPSVLDENSVIISLEIGKPGTRKKVKTSKLDFGEAQPEAFSVTKEVLASRYHDLISKQDEVHRVWLKARSLPTAIMRSGSYRVPLDLVEAVEAKLGGYAQWRKDTVEEFLNSEEEGGYASAKEAAKVRLAGFYDDAEFPTKAQLRDAYYFRWKYVAVGTPEKLAQISPTLLKQEQEKAGATLRSEMDIIRTALREEFAKLCEHAASKLAIQDGKKPVFRDSLVTNITQFLDVFDSRNLLGDPDLKKLADEARKVMKGVTNADQLRTDDALRANVAKQFAQVKEALDATGSVVLPDDRSIELD